MPEEKSKVDELSDNLYSRTRYEAPEYRRSSVRAVDTPDAEEKWQGPELNEMLAQERKPTEVKPFVKKVFTFAVLFFVATIGIAGFVFLGGVNFISSKNVDIDIVGPTTASVGGVVELGVTIKNGNNSDLDLANFSVQYPSGSRDPQDSGKALSFTREELGVIEAGNESVRNIRLVLIGSPGEVKEFKLSVEYKVKGSNATFYKDKIYQITIGDSPLSLEIESPASVTSGESFTTTVNVTLDSTEVLKNVMLRAEYPYGYSVSSASPAAFSENNVWALGDLSPGVTKKVEIRGTLLGENQDERTFRFYVGSSESGGSNANFKTVILSAQKTIAIERPSLALSANFNGDNTATYITSHGIPVSVAVRFGNNLPEKLLNPKLEVRLTGSALNKNSVVVENSGLYNAASSRINWDLKNIQGLSELSPGDNGVVVFSLASLQDAFITGEIGLQFIFSGTPVGTNSPVSVSETRKIKVASQVTLSAKALYSIGAFENTGPIPPKVGQETTYTVVWTVVNTQADVVNAKVTARLGSGVKWVVGPEVASEMISYNEASNTITWDIKELTARQGTVSPPREVAFQVSIKPVGGQVGTAPTLVNSILFTGTSGLDSSRLSISAPALNTRLLSDPAFIQGDDIVVK